MQPFRTLTGVAASLPRDDVDTDQILPTPYLRDPKADLARGLFGYLRTDESTSPRFVLDEPAYAQTRILVVGRNFGCGSSREHAVWAVKAFGIGCIVGESFADTFRENCLRNGILPVVMPRADMVRLHEAVQRAAGARPFTVDLAAQQIEGHDGSAFTFEMGRSEKRALLEGLDDIGVTLVQADAIAEWERSTAAARPFMQITPPMGAFWPAPGSPPPAGSEAG